MLTKSGLGTIVVAIALAMFGFWWRYEELVITAVGLAVAVLLAIGVAQRPFSAPVDRRITAIRVARGDPIHLSYRVRNGTRFRTGRATFIDVCDGQVCRTLVEPVEPGSVVDFFGNLPTTRRGIFDVGPLEIERIDPFWLAVGTRRHATTSHVTVHPKVYELFGPQGAARVVENESTLRRASADPMSGFVSMREYVAGDDPRLIHWPTTARTGTLMVREHVEVRRPEFTIVLDTAASAASAADFEEQVDVAASLASHAVRTGLDVVLRSTSRLAPGVRAPIFDEGTVLDFLTPIQQSPPEDLLSVASLFTQGFDHTSVIMVTGPQGPSSRFSSMEQMLIVRIGEGAAAMTGVAVAASDAAEFVTRWRNWT